MSLFVGFLVEAEGLLAVGPVRNDGFGASVFQPLPQLRTVVGFVAQKLLGRRGAPDYTLGQRAIMCFAPAQEDGKKTAFNICDCVDLRIAPAA